MYFNGINYPDELVNSIIDNKLVVFVGAGVSMGKPTLLPNFDVLAEEIAKGTGKVKDSIENCDVFLGRLKFQGINVNRRAAEILSKKNLKPNKLHHNIIKVFPHIRDIKIVTTNYDNMLEITLKEMNFNNVKIYDAPALPLGDNVKGIIHIHGNISEPENMIITDEDFGKAYLADGYVSRFLVQLFENYTVLFVGYSYDDIIVQYLTRAFSKYQSCRRYID